jgi:uncharacterized protein YkwD
MNPELALKVAALLAALTAITVEDLKAIKDESTLGPDVAENIANFQSSVQSIEQSAIDQLNAARTANGLPAL